MIRNQIQRISCVATCIFIGLLAGVPVVGADAPPPSTSRFPATGSQAFLPLIRKSDNPPSQSGCASPISTGAEWPMLAANPQRTSWTPEEVRCNLSVAWYRPIEPYIPYKVQPIAAMGKIFVSTARGLYAINANSGNVDWVYPTELPLGHSPTVANVNGTSTAYVGGYDHKIHAVNTANGTDIAGYTPYEAIAGFDTNPLVIQDSNTNNIPTILAGNRDGYFYALNAINGSLVWKYQTGGPILYSAAYKNGTAYFASNDLYAYALNVSNGSLVWKSQKLLGAGFHHYWPVLYTEKSSGKDYVIFTGSDNFRQSEQLDLQHVDQSYLFPCATTGACSNNWQVIWPIGTSSGPNNYWGHSVETIDVSAINNYFQNKPQYHTSFILNISNGQEYTFDSNGDGIFEYAPFTFTGVTSSGNKYPPLASGADNVLYHDTLYVQVNYISRGHIVGWKWGDHFVSRVYDRDVGEAMDEPTAFASGGKLIYWSLCCDRIAGSFDVTIPYGQPDRAWNYYTYNLMNLAPDYDPMYNDGDSSTYTNGNGWQLYSGKNQSKNGVYGKHGITQSPPIPYQGKVYMLRGNTLIAWNASGGSTELPLATVVSTQSAPTPPTKIELTQRLETLVQKMTTAGHLRPGYFGAGAIDLIGDGSQIGDPGLGEIFDYFQNPADTVYTLLLAYPYLSPTTQSQAKTYLVNNYGPGAPYDFTKIVHIGWGTGAKRELSDIPPEDFAVFGTPYNPPLSPSTAPICGSCGYWHSFPPFSFYAAWKYAQIVGNSDPNFANSILSAISGKIEAMPGYPNVTTYIVNRPYLQNLYIAGYYGYLQLQQLAGQSPDSTVQSWYNAGLSLRTTQFQKDTQWPSGFNNGVNSYPNSLAVARNFMFMTPELGAYLNQNLLTQIQTAMNEYTYVAPYWFVQKYDNSYGEGTFQSLYDSPALFQAKAWILKQPYNELVKWLDVPAFYQGDLFYIQNLVAALSAP